MVRDHFTETLMVYQSHRMRAELRGQHAIERGGRSASLQMAQHDASALAVQPRFDLGGDEWPDAAQPGLTLIGVWRLVDQMSARPARPLGDDHEREFLALCLAIENLVAQVLERPRNFRNQNHVAAAGDASVQ